MQRISISPGCSPRAAIGHAVEALRAGQVVAFPTDTLYALAVDPRSARAVERLFALKGREATAAVPLIAASPEQAAMAAHFGERERRAAEMFWPGPLSIVLPAKPSIVSEALAGGRTVAIRVPAHALARDLASAFGFCITATSANRSGSPPCESADAVAAALPEVDLVADGGRSPGGAPSTIISFDDDGPVLLREGAVAWDRVIKSLR